MRARSTKYSTAALDALNKLGHATNFELLDKVRVLFPDVSATTIHRVTSRLLGRDIIAKAPSDNFGSMRYDSNTKPHDHFICSICGGIRDIDVAESFVPKISAEMGGCSISGRLVIYGDCEKCKVSLRKDIKK